MDLSMIQQVQLLSKKLIAHQWKLVTAESCTGGGLAYLLTMLSGSSAWFERGFVTYSNSSKEDLLGVKSSTLLSYGAVSEQVACEMAEGALRRSRANISIAITGIAGPEGGTAEKPVGTVWFACGGGCRKTEAWKQVFSGDRQEVREQAVMFALEKLGAWFL